jgi:hypothetical protein
MVPSCFLNRLTNFRHVEPSAAGCQRASSLQIKGFFSDGQMLPSFSRSLAVRAARGIFFRRRRNRPVEPPDFQIVSL